MNDDEFQDENVSEVDGGIDSTTSDDEMAIEQPVAKKTGKKRMLIGFAVLIIAVVIAAASLLFSSGTDVKTISSKTANPLNNNSLVHVAGPIKTTDFTDPMLNVTANGIFLERKVEIFQWIENNGEFDKKWFDKIIDVKDSDHQNPKNFLIKSNKWDSPEIKLGAFRLSESLAQKIQSKDPVPLTPKTFAKLNESGQKAFKLDQGKYYYYGLDPAAPEIGDFRISFNSANPGSASIIAKQTGATLNAYISDNGRIEKLRMGTHNLETMTQGLELDSGGLIMWVLRAISALFFLVAIIVIIGKKKKPAPTEQISMESLRAEINDDMEEEEEHIDPEEPAQEEVADQPIIEEVEAAEPEHIQPAEPAAEMAYSEPEPAMPPAAPGIESSEQFLFDTNEEADAEEENGDSLPHTPEPLEFNPDSEPLAPPEIPAEIEAPEPYIEAPAEEIPEQIAPVAEEADQELNAAYTNEATDSPPIETTEVYSTPPQNELPAGVEMVGPGTAAIDEYRPQDIAIETDQGPEPLAFDDAPPAAEENDTTQEESDYNSLESVEMVGPDTAATGEAPPTLSNEEISELPTLEPEPLPDAEPILPLEPVNFEPEIAPEPIEMEETLPPPPEPLDFEVQDEVDVEEESDGEVPPLPLPEILNQIRDSLAEPEEETTEDNSEFNLPPPPTDFDPAAEMPPPPVLEPTEEAVISDDSEQFDPFSHDDDDSVSPFDIDNDEQK